MRAARAAIVLCMALSTAMGTWYLRIRIPDKDWSTSCRAGKEAMNLGRFSEAERHFLAAVEAARAFGEEDRRLADAQFLLAQALVGQARLTDALRLLERSVAIYTKVLGREHAESSHVIEYYTRIRDEAASTHAPGAIPGKIPDAPSRR